MSGSLVYRLPDCYAKPVRYRETETATNTWRLFEINAVQTKLIQNTITDLYRQLDLRTCSGDALERFGVMYNIPRPEGASDDIYRVELLAKISSYFSDGSINYVLHAVAFACQKELGTIYFTESSPAMVTMHIRSLEAADSLPVTLEQLKTIVEMLLPVGVGLEPVILIDECFQYCSIGEEENSDLDGTGYNEQTAGLGSYQIWEGDRI